MKHYFFVPIIVVLVVNKILLTATMIGLQRLKVEYYDTRIVRERLIASNRISEANELPVISCDRLNKVIYM